MSSLASNAGVIAATAGLAQVQAVIGAMNGANGQSAGPLGPISSPPAAEYAPRVTTDQQVCYAPRRVIHPEPRYLPRPVLHPTPRVEWGMGAAPAPKARPPHITPGPPPPWKIPPQSLPLAPIMRDIKLRPGQPDYIDRGLLIDLFM